MMLRQRLALTGVLLGLAGLVAGEVVWIATAGSAPVGGEPGAAAGVVSTSGSGEARPEIAPAPIGMPDQPKRSLPGAVLEGTVTDSRGQPVPAALVEAIPPESGGSMRRFVTRCDENGRFVLESLGQDVYRLRVRAVGFLANSKGNIRISDSPARSQVDFVLERTDTVMGLVTSRAARQPRKE